QLREKEAVAFPNDFRRDAVSGELHEKYGEKSAEELEALNIEVAIAGRMMTQLREKEAVAFPNDFRRDAVSGELHEKYGEKSAE
ncbi:hypothetical protein CQA04_27440, partial [Escherichia coli]